MNEIQLAIFNLLPPRRKTNQSGGFSFNAVCCIHRGETRDTKSRAGVLFGSDGSFVYHCFNCGFSAGWSAGKLLTKNTRDLFKWLGLAEIEVQKLNLLALRLKDDQPITDNHLNFDLEVRSLPDNCRAVDNWIRDGIDDPDLLDVVEYIINRGMGWDWYPWHWSPEPGYRDRVIIPFYQDGKIVGYTGRKIRPGNPKYLSNSQSGYVFNIDRQDYARKYVIAVEGQFDAIAIDGVAIMTNEPNQIQCARISRLGREVIVVPDRDRSGAKMVAAAVENNWTVSLPPWGNDIKDVADAVKKFGRIYTLYSILHYRETNKLKNQILEKKLGNL